MNDRALDEFYKFTLEPIDAPIDLEPLASKVRASSHFRFSWQFFSCPLPARNETDDIRAILNVVIDRPDCHQFLIDPSQREPFTIERLHQHVGFGRADGSFEGALARAAADQLGAHSRIQADASAAQVAEISALLGSLGSYQAFELQPGSAVGCGACKHHNNHLFTSWFYGVAWDWLFCVLWTERPFVWIGCLSDTD